MNRSLIALWLTLVAAIATIVVLSQFWLRQRQLNSRERVTEILRSQLVPVNDSVRRVVNGYSIQLQRQLDAADLSDLNTCVELSRLPIIETLIVVDHRGQLYFPRNVAALPSDRQSLIDEALQLLREQFDPRPGPTAAADQSDGIDAADGLDLQTEQLRSNSYIVQNEVVVNQSQLIKEPSGEQTGDDRAAPGSAIPAIEAQDQLESQNYGWITWYHRRGMVLGFWWRQSDRWLSITVLPRARWLADIVAALPDAEPARASTGPTQPEIGAALKQLVDVEGNVVYQWSRSPQEDWEKLAQSAIDAELPVAPPLEGWRLRTFASARLRQALAGDDATGTVWIAVLGVSMAVLLGGVLATVNLNRQLQSPP